MKEDLVDIATNGRELFVGFQQEIFVDGRVGAIDEHLLQLQELAKGKTEFADGRNGH